MLGEGGGGGRNYCHLYEAFILRALTVYPSPVLVSCPAHTHLPERNGLVNEVEFLGLITQIW